MIGSVPKALSIACVTILVLSSFAAFAPREEKAIAQPLASVSDLRIPGGFFTANQGQVRNKDVLYYSASGGLQVAFLDGGLLFRVASPSPSLPTTISPKERAEALYHSGMTGGVNVRLAFAGANNVAPQGRGELPYRSNFFLGNDSANWRTDVRNYREIVYENLYDGIDLVYRASTRGLKYEFDVRPWADPSRIRINYEGVEGLRLDSGALVWTTAVGAFRDSAPDSYQGDHPISCAFVVWEGASQGFDCQGWDRSRPMVIDPLVYSTYLGGTGVDWGGWGIAVDSTGNAYVTGYTMSVDFPVTPGAFSTNLSGSVWDGFVAKLDPTGSSLVYSTYFGGPIGGEEGLAIAVDTAGNAYVTGTGAYVDFPATHRIPAGVAGVAFVLKLNSMGNALFYSTVIGSPGPIGGDGGTGIAIDALGDAFVTGWTYGPNFPVTLGAFDTTFNATTPANYTGFALELNPSGDALVYSTFLDDSYPTGITIDVAGNAFIAGIAFNTFPVTPGAFDTILGGCCDAFIAKLGPSGNALVYSTLVGGSAEDEAEGIAIDSGGNAYIAGRTGSADFPTTPGAFDRDFEAPNPTQYGTAFVTKANPNGTGLVYSTFLGGDTDCCGDWAYDIAVDGRGRAFVAGTTNSPDFPTTPGAFDRSYHGIDVFLSVFDPQGGSLDYSTYIGGRRAGTQDTAFSLAVDARGFAYLTGVTTSVDYPTTPGAFDTTFNDICPNPSTCKGTSL